MTPSKLMYKNIPDMICDRAQTWADRPVINRIKVNRLVPYYWNDYFGDISDLAMGLAELGLRMSDRIAILSESSVEWIMADSASLSLGAVTVPIFPSYRKRDVEYILKHCEARGIFIADEKQLEKVEAIKAKYGAQFLIISLKAFDNPDVYSLQQVMEIGQKAGNRDLNIKNFKGRVKRIGESDLASIIYTSGTTGTPKGVMLTHGNFLSNCDGFSDVVDVEPGLRSLSVLPLSHVLERTVGYYYFFLNGVEVSISQGLTKIAKELLIVRPHVAIFVPRLFEKFYHRILSKMKSASDFQQKLFEWAVNIGKQKYVYAVRKEREPLFFKIAHIIVDHLVFKKIRAVFGGKPKWLVSGGAKLPREIGRFFYAAGLTLLEGYGLTETSPVVSVNPPENNKIGTVGPALKNLEVKLAESGELLIKGPSIMKGYFRDEDATDAVLQDGWLNSGDLATIDDDGYIKILGRKKDLIVTLGGKNISPQMIENILEADPFISQSFICGDEEKYIAVLLVPDFDSLKQYAQQHNIHYSDIAELVEAPEVTNLYKKCIDAANKELADFEKIKSFCLLPDEFSVETGELTPTLKVKRNVVLVKYKSYINKLYRRD